MGGCQSIQRASQMNLLLPGDRLAAGTRWRVGDNRPARAELSFDQNGLRADGAVA
jgi:hypothetical protein